MLQPGGTRAELWAHSPRELGPPHSLYQHLQAVSEKAAQFGAKFGCGDLARYAGWLHDIGKADSAFQSYLRAERNRGPSHKLPGALLAAEVDPFVAMAIAGHHHHLPSRAELKSTLRDVSTDVIELCRELAKRWDLNSEFEVRQPNSSSAAEMQIRMLFSALVDADYLDTESHFQPEHVPVRLQQIELGAMKGRLEDQLDKFRTAPATNVNLLRRTVAEHCITSASLAPGVYRLTVPTGGGKTLASLAFALNHALEHSMDRVIVAIPYTSIIEQTARVYRDIFDERVVLEHHSAIESDDEGEGSWQKLAAENWDAPLVVTTTIQLFESLFAARPSQCRKLHNIARSVIVLDEVQTLPLHLLQPILNSLRLLVDEYGCTVLLCTATQPALDHQSPFLQGFASVQEIGLTPDHSFAVLQRVDYIIEERPLSFEEVAERVCATRSGMVILNTKKDALRVWQALDDSQAFFLSTSLCAAHRRQVLEEVTARLKGGLPCRLVTTQVVEAGVDLDFPVVFRAMGPLDRIVQAAGRCNREGTLPSRGKVVVFDLIDGSLPLGSYRTATSIAQRFLASGECDLHSPSVFASYFEQLYASTDVRGRPVIEAQEAFDYPLVAERFRMIEEETTPVLVPYAEDSSVHDAVRGLRERSGNARSHWRRLQPYLVSLPRYILQRSEHEGLCVEIVPGLWQWVGRYDIRCGVLAEADPERFIQ